MIGAMNAPSIYLIRHASPDRVKKSLPYHLPPGPPLTALGRAEAYAVGDFLRNAGVRRLYSSPLERCQETARIACQAADACIEVDERLIEWQPEDTPESVRSRMLAIFKQVVDWNDEVNSGRSEIGLVTHGGPIAMLLESLGMEATVLASYRRFDSNNPLPPAAVWRVSQAGDGDSWSFELAFMPEITLV